MNEKSEQYIRDNLKLVESTLSVIWLVEADGDEYQYDPEFEPDRVILLEGYDEVDKFTRSFYSE